MLQRGGDRPALARRTLLRPDTLNVGPRAAQLKREHRVRNGAIRARSGPARHEAANTASSASRHAAFLASSAKLASNEFAASRCASARPIDGCAANSAS
jgi:hypothetical protein